MSNVKSKGFSLDLPDRLRDYIEKIHVIDPRLSRGMIIKTCIMRCQMADEKSNYEQWKNQLTPTE